jgi:hypothetical protein
MEKEKITSKKGEYTSWEKIKKLHPDKFVLLENPVYEGDVHLKEAILLYKHRNRKKVIEKELELKPHFSTLLYTGGIRGDRAAEMVWVL